MVRVAAGTSMTITITHTLISTIGRVEAVSIKHSHPVPYPKARVNAAHSSKRAMQQGLQGAGVTGTSEATSPVTSTSTSTPNSIANSTSTSSNNTG
jgi:hypothetical protein